MSDRKDYFKYVRVRQKTKVDHAEPDRVFEVIDAVRRRPSSLFFKKNFKMI